MSVRITCISKAGGNHENPHVAISDLGWINEATNASGNSTRLQMYDFIKNQGSSAYVRDKYNNTIGVYATETSMGTKYVRTYSDKVWTDNLLALSECVRA